MATIREGYRRVLLVVDTQVGVVTGCWEADRVIANISYAIGRARAHRVPVLWVQHSDDELSIDSPGWQWAPGLAPAAGAPVVHKLYNSAFE